MGVQCIVSLCFCIETFALKFGGTFPWEPEGNTTCVACPDPYNTVVFKLIALDE